MVTRFGDVVAFQGFAAHFVIFMTHFFEKQNAADFLELKVSGA